MIARPQINCQKNQLPTPKVSGGESRGDFYPGGTRYLLWALEVGGWELTSVGRYPSHHQLASATAAPVRLSTA
jgi:hypothetical protein